MSAAPAGLPGLPFHLAVAVHQQRSASRTVTIRDVTRPVVLDTEFEGQVNDPWDNRRVAFTATTQIGRKEFGVKWNQMIETGGVVVGDNVRINLHIEAVRQS